MERQGEGRALQRRRRAALFVFISSPSGHWRAQLDMLLLRGRGAGRQAALTPALAGLHLHGGALIAYIWTPI
jgi:hypothetical protein